MRSPGLGTSVAFHCASVPVSSSVARSRSEIRRSGSATTDSIRARSRPSIRSIVAASKRSVAYSSEPEKPSGVSAIANERSNFAVPVPDPPNGSSVRPAGTTSGSWLFWSTNIAWKSGVRLGSRSGWIASTSNSSGRS